MEAISSRKTLQQTAAGHGGHPHSVESSDGWEAEVKVARFIWRYRHGRSLITLDCKIPSQASTKNQILLLPSGTNDALQRPNLSNKRHSPQGPDQQRGRALLSINGCPDQISCCLGNDLQEIRRNCAQHDEMEREKAWYLFP
jgi:hypothetical protein